MAETEAKSKKTKAKTSRETLLEAFKLMCTAKTLAEKYEANKEVTSNMCMRRHVGTKQFNLPAECI